MPVLLQDQCRTSRVLKAIGWHAKRNALPATSCPANSIPSSLFGRPGGAWGERRPFSSRGFVRFAGSASELWRASSRQFIHTFAEQVTPLNHSNSGPCFASRKWFVDGIF